MGKTVAVSFEGDSVRIIHAAFRGKSITVNKAETVPENEFNDYLSREKSTEFIVTSEFRESFHGVITTPVVKDEFLKKIISSEIKKVIIQKDFSFIFTQIGEKVVENKRILEIFYYAVPKDSIREVIERFYDNGKIVRALYPSVFSAAALIDSGVQGEAHMGIFRAGKSRFAFFIRKGKIYFIRNYESFDADLSDFDIQNINMTVSYCFQNIRMNPSSVFMMGPLAGSFQINAMSTAPLACFARPDHVHCSCETFNEYILPIASFYTTRTSNILSKEFMDIYKLKSYMTNASKAFIILTILCIGAITYEFIIVKDRKGQIENAKKSGAAIEKILTEYSVREDKKNNYLPVAEFLNKPVPNMQKMLISLGETEFKGLSLNEINASLNSDNNFTVFLNGNAFTDTYSAMQDNLDNMEKDLVKTGNIEITNRSLELKDKTFSIEMTFKTVE